MQSATPTRRRWRFPVVMVAATTVVAAATVFMVNTRISGHQSTRASTTFW